MTVYLTVDGFLVPVEILERRTVYGRAECYVTPIGGSGKAWVVANRLVSPVTPKEGNQ